MKGTVVRISQQDIELSRYEMRELTLMGIKYQKIGEIKVD